MDRRGFLTALGAFAATAVLDPEKLLWRPGAKRIFIPKPSELVYASISLHPDDNFDFSQNIIYGYPEYFITSLDDDGPETLRDAARQPSPKMLVFQVRGTLNINAPVDFSRLPIAFSSSSPPPE